MTDGNNRFTDAASELDRLRAEIKEADEAILNGMKKRLDTAEKIGRLKLEARIPVRNEAVEETVVGRYRRFAEACGMDPDDAELVCRTLIRASVEEQASLVRPDRVLKKIAVIGGYGKMGAWFARLLSGAGHHVFPIGRDDAKNLSETAAKDADVVIVSTPVSVTDETLEKLDDVCRPDALIFDLSSLKSPFSKRLSDMARRRFVCSVHPMFGPSAKSLYDRNLLVCDCGCQKAVADVLSLFGDHGGNVKVIDLAMHDAYMAYVLGLSHAVNIAFFTVLDESGIPFEEMSSVASTTFRKIMDTNMSVALEDPHLYYEIQHLNARSTEMWMRFTQAIDKVQKASLSGDPSEFVKIMDRGRLYFDRG